MQRNIKFTVFAVENVSGPHKLLLLSCVTLRNYRNSIFMIIQCIGVHIRYNTKHMTWSQRLFIDQEKWTTLTNSSVSLCGYVGDIHCFVFWTAQNGKFCHYWFFRMHKGFALKFCSASHPNNLVFFIISRNKIQTSNTFTLHVKITQKILLELRVFSSVRKVDLPFIKDNIFSVEDSLCVSVLII